MKMKLALLSLILNYNISTNAQSKVVVNPYEFIGKIVLSKVEIKNKKLDADKTALKVEGDGNKISVGKGIVSESVWRVISFSEKDNHILLERKVKRVLRETASRMGISLYDSDNRFERDPMATSQGTSIDPMIDKIFISEFDIKNLVFINNQSKSTNFSSIWKPKVPFLEKDEELAGIFIYRLPEILKSGTIWTDSSETNLVSTKKTYKVKSIDAEKVIIEFTDYRLPGAKSEDVKSNNNEVKGNFESTLYQGEMIINAKNGFIYEMNYKLESRVKLIVMGKETRFDVDSEVKIKNEVK